MSRNMNISVFLVFFGVCAIRNGIQKPIVDRRMKVPGNDAINSNELKSRLLLHHFGDMREQDGPS